MSELAVACMWMRGGTSKGGYFLADDLPGDEAARDRFLLAAFGSPDARQIDGMGGANPLASKVAVVSRSQRPDVDVDYLFLQVFVDEPIVTDRQNCGNILAGVGPFSIERGLVTPNDGETEVRIHLRNTGQTATVTVSTPGGVVGYAGEAKIAGVPGGAAPIPISFDETAGSSCGALLPTGHAVDEIDGIACTLIDNGMPCVVLRASDVGLEGTETPAEVEANRDACERIEALRLVAGPLMNLGDVGDKSVPKMTLVSAATAGGAIATRTLIPKRCHSSIGVLGAVSVASACLLEHGPAAELADTGDGDRRELAIEHPSGETVVTAWLDGEGQIQRTAIRRTARKLFDGQLFVHRD